MLRAAPIRFDAPIDTLSGAWRASLQVQSSMQRPLRAKVASFSKFDGIMVSKGLTVRFAREPACRKIPHRIGRGA
jgi:hypothetical protein